MDGTGVQGSFRNVSVMEQVVALQAANLRKRKGTVMGIRISGTHLTNAIIKLSSNVSGTLTTAGEGNRYRN